MTNNELLTRHKETCNVYLRSLSNSEWEALDIISNFQMTDENQMTKFLSIRNSANDRLRKVRELDDTMLSILEQADAVQEELETVLSRDDRIQELIVKIECCMNKVPKESIKTSCVMSSSSPSPLSHDPEVKVMLPKHLNLTVILLIFEDFRINIIPLYIKMTVLMIYI